MVLKMFFEERFKVAFKIIQFQFYPIDHGAAKNGETDYLVTNELSMSNLTYQSLAEKR
jgi:hypothetical protein